jgi:hypothetical protein
MAQAPILTRGSAFVFPEEASRAVASALPFTDLAQLDVLGRVPDYGLQLYEPGPSARIGISRDRLRQAVDSSEAGGS